MASLTSSFLFQLRHCDSFIFQDTTVIGSLVQSAKNLKIVFPDGNILLYSEATSYYPAAIAAGAGNLGDSGSDILGDLDEWGFNQYSPIIYADLDTLKADIALNPAMFTDADGKPTTFTYDAFPDGSYKITWSFVTSSGTHTCTKRVFNTCTLQACIKGMVDEYFQIKCTGDCDSKTQYRKVISELLMLMEAAEYDNTQGEYTEARAKLTAALTYCGTGTLSYKEGC